MNQAENLQERVVIVNDKNEILGHEYRKVMREKSLFHQASFILLINDLGQICTHLRHKDKLWCGGYWTTVFGGCVSEGENYVTNAIKELEEEAGVKLDKELEELECFCYKTDTQKVWGKVFWSFYNGEINFQKEEIQEIKWRSVQQIKEMKDQFTPDGNMAFDILLDYARQQKDIDHRFKLMITDG